MSKFPSGKRGGAEGDGVSAKQGIDGLVSKFPPGGGVPQRGGVVFIGVLRIGSNCHSCGARRGSITLCSVYHRNCVYIAFRAILIL